MKIIGHVKCFYFWQFFLIDFLEMVFLEQNLLAKTKKRFFGKWSPRPSERARHFSKEELFLFFPLSFESTSNQWNVYHFFYKILLEWKTIGYIVGLSIFISALLKASINFQERKSDQCNTKNQVRVISK